MRCSATAQAYRLREPDEGSHAPRNPVASVGIEMIGLADRATATAEHPGHACSIEPHAHETLQIGEPFFAAVRMKRGLGYRVLRGKRRLDVGSHFEGVAPDRGP